MISKSELKTLRRFIEGQLKGETSPLDRLWAGRSAALLDELKHLEQQVEKLSGEIDAVADKELSDTCII